MDDAEKAAPVGAETDIIIEPSAGDMARRGAEICCQSAHASVDRLGRFALAISGGSSPREMHRLLAEERYSSRLPWGKIHIFWVDERCLPVTHPDSNFGTAKKDFLDRVPIVPEHVHPMPGWVPPEQGAIRYEKELMAFFQRTADSRPCFDLMFLGIGQDGHTASLFPGQASLKEKEKWVLWVRGGHPRVDRLTMTFPVLNLARQTVFLASGRDKAKVLKTVLESPGAQLPAQKVRPSRGSLTWLVDRKAALLLKKTEGLCASLRQGLSRGCCPDVFPQAQGAAVPRRRAVTRSALQYHRQTCYDRHDMKGHALDWPNQPNVFKSYPGLKTVPLPEVTAWPQDDLSTLLRKHSHHRGATNVTLIKLAQIIRLTHALTAKARVSGTVFYYRSVASAGALYPFELYVAVRGTSGLDDGLYHHSIGLEALTALRSGNMMPNVSDALRAGPGDSPVLVFFLTAIFFRSSWKYRDRAYRYHLLDTGHLAENLLLALRAENLSPTLYYDFDDAKMNDLLGVDPRREVCLAVVCVWGKEAGGQKEAGDLKIPAKTLTHASRVSDREVDYTVIRDLHTASCRVVEPARGIPKMLHNLGLKTQPARQIPRTDTWPEVMNYAHAVFKRRSRRNFVQTELSVTKLGALLELLCATRGEQGDVRSFATEALSVGFLSGNVQDLNPGFYVLDLGQGGMALSSQGFMIDKMAHVCLDQAWLANSALHFVFLTNLKLLDETWGPRGYRYAMLTAGRLGQRIYLATTAMGIGCCGIGAFYDDEAAQLLGLNEPTRLLYLVAAGPLKR